MRIIDTSGALLSAFRDGVFDLTEWESYMAAHVPGVGALCLEDRDDCIRGGFSWEKDFLPVLNAVLRDTERRAQTIASFRQVTDHLEEKILDRFGKSLDVDVILYLGLCNGAGWVTTVEGKTVVLLGIEKIMELDWCDTDAMTGLIVHELGHVYQNQYGVLHRETDSLPDHFLWQLFTEGIAMVFEQEICGDPDYYHQDTDGWRDWCKHRAAWIRQSFCDDLKTMTRETQRYFGDWVRLEGYGDTGYYLGARFVRFLLDTDSFDRLIRYEIGEVKDGFARFMDAPL